MSRYAYFNQVGLKLWSVGKDRLHIGYAQSETSAKGIVAELNELLERADEIEADSIRAIAALTADRDRLADENTELREALEEIIAWKDRANDDRQEVNEMVVVAERALRLGKAGE